MKVPGSDRLELPAIDRATYELLAEVAHTANGTVWRAKSFLLLREVAIKLIPAERDSSGRTLREARIASQLDHPNIVRVHSFGTWDDQQTALVMEWIEGESLNDLIPSLVSAHGASELSLKCSDQLTAMFTRCQRPVSAAHVKHSKAKLLFERLALDDALREISASAKLYEQIPERSKDHIDYLELLVLRGQVYAISGNQAEAEKIMQQLARQACAVAGDPSRRASIVAEAGYYYVVYCKKTTIGENLFQDAVQLSDDVVTKWRLLLRKGYAYMQRRDVTAVERVLSEMRLLLPVPEGHKDIQCQYNEIMIQVMVMKGNVKARELIEKQLDYCADYPYLRPYKSRTYWLRGLALLEEGNAESGLQNLKLSINHMGPITDAKLKGLLQEYVGLVERKEYGKARWKALQARANRAVGLQW